MAAPGGTVAPFPFALFGLEGMDTPAKNVDGPSPDLSIFSAYATPEKPSAEGVRQALVRHLAEEHRAAELIQDGLSNGAKIQDTVTGPSERVGWSAGADLPTGLVAPPFPFGGLAVRDVPSPALPVAKPTLAPCSRVVAVDGLGVAAGVPGPAGGSEIAPLLPIPGLPGRPPGAPSVAPAAVVRSPSVVSVGGGEAVPPFARLSPPVPEAASLAPLVIPTAFGRSAAPFLPTSFPPAPLPEERKLATAPGHDWSRIALVAVALFAAVGAAAYFFRDSGIFSRTLGPQVTARSEAPVDGGKFGGPIPVSPPVVETVPEPAPRVVSTERPAPSPEFSRLVSDFKISGVLQGTPVVALVNGRKVRAGELVSVESNVRLVDADFAGRRLIFEDGTTARASVRY